MLLIVQIFATLAALLHVYIWVMECLIFDKPRVYSGVFGMPESDVETVRSWAFNQGFYNLFLAVGALVGAALVRVSAGAGWALIVFTCGSMLGAALVLVARDRSKAKAALTQGLLPALTLAFAATQL